MGGIVAAEEGLRVEVGALGKCIFKGLSRARIPRSSLHEIPNLRKRTFLHVCKQL